MWTVAKYLRLFAETYQQILYQKSIDTIRYPYHSLNLARPRKKFNFFIRFYYYSDSNIKVKFDEELRHRLNLVYTSYKKQVNSYFSPQLMPQLPCTRPWQAEILIAMLLLLRVLFQFQHVLIKVGHKQSVLNNTIFFKFSFSFCLGNLSSDFACILKNLSVICHQK